MPHLSIEYTKNLKTKISTEALLRQVHDSIQQCPGLDINRVKSRLVEHEWVHTEKSGSETQMIHITLAILSGRDEVSKKLYAKTIFEALQKFIPIELLDSVSLTLEVREMNRDYYLKN